MTNKSKRILNEFIKSCINSVINIVLIMCHCKAPIISFFAALCEYLMIFGLCNFEKFIAQAMNHLKVFVIELSIFMYRDEIIKNKDNQPRIALIFEAVSSCEVMFCR